MLKVNFKDFVQKQLGAKNDPAFSYKHPSNGFYELLEIMSEGRMQVEATQKEAWGDI